MKRAISVLAAFVLLVSMTACSSKNDVKKESPKTPVQKEEEVINNSGKETENYQSTEKEEDITPVTEHTKSFFNSIPGEFIFSDKAGTGKTVLTISEDGTFTGKYSDTNAGEKGSAYPNGTVYICNFSGKFAQPIPLDDFTFISKLEKTDMEETPRTSEIKDGVKYVYTTPYGLENAQEVVFYKPGAAASLLTEELMNQLPMKNEIKDTIPENVFVLCNLKEQTAFVGENK